MTYTAEVTEPHNIILHMKGSPMPLVLHRHQGDKYEFKTLSEAEAFVKAHGEHSDKYTIYKGHGE